MSRQSDITVRLSTKGADQVKRALESMGREGQAALRQIEAASKAAQPQSRALARALDDVGNQVGGLGRDVPGLSEGLRGLGPVGNVVAGGLGLAAAAIGGAFAASKQLAVGLDELADTADRLNVDVEQYQELVFALEETGGAAADVQAGLQGLNSAIGTIQAGLRGSDRAMDLFVRVLKIPEETVRSWRTATDALPAIANGIAGIRDEAVRARVLEALNLVAWGPLLRDGEAGFYAVTAAARELNQVIDRETIATFGEFNRQTELSANKMQKAFADALVGMVPVFNWFMDRVTDLANLVASVGQTVSWMWNWGRDIANTPTTPASDPLDGASTGGFRPEGPGRPQQSPQAGIPARPPPARAPRAPRAPSGPDPELERQRRETANRAAMERADREELQASLAMARTEQERLAIRRQLADLEARQALAAIDADQQLTEETKARQRKVVADRRAAALAEIEADQAQLAQTEAEAAREEVRRRNRVAAAAADKAQAARDAADEARRREAEVIADAEMLAAQTAAEQAETRRDQMDAELRILDLTTRRMLNEIDLLQVSEEAKALARKAVKDAAAARERQIREGARGGVAGYLGELEREARTLGDRLDDVASDGLKGFEDALVAIGTGAKDAKDAFKDMAASILADLIRLAARQWVILPLMQMMGIGGKGGGDFQMPMPSGGGGGGGAMNFLAQLLPNILRFGGGFGGGRASGGPVRAGVTYLTGERGPELFVPNVSGTILPNHVLQAAGGHGGGGGGWGRPQLAVHVHNAPAGTQVRQRPDGGADVFLPRLEAVEGRVARIDGTFEERTLETITQAERRGMR